MTTESKIGGRMEKILVGSALGLAAIFLAILFYSVNFLSGNLLNALAPNTAIPQATHFDLQGAASLFPQTGQ